MGNGGFGTNESMHWKISHSDRAGDLPHSTGRDPIPVDQIGRGSQGEGGPPDGKDYPGYLLVRLRFTGTAGMNSLVQLKDYLDKNVPTSDYALEIKVPTIRRTQREIDDGTKDPWEVRVDW
jgi:hypothetical protein